MNRLTGKINELSEWLAHIRSMPEVMDHVTHWHTIPAREAKYADFPSDLHPKLRQMLLHKQIDRLYTHQATAFAEIRQGNNVVAVTPTASGKTLCYNLPVLQTLLEDDSARALYLFPTKALAQDQVAELQELVDCDGRRISRRIHMTAIRRQRVGKRFATPDISS